MTSDPQHQGNGVLASLMAEAGLSPRGLARQINRAAGPGTVAETAPYYWRDAGGVPREPLPAITATVLSRCLGRNVDVDDLWQRPAGGSSRFLAADAGMGERWTRASAATVIDDWLHGGLLDRRVFLSLSGAALARAVSVYLAANVPTQVIYDPQVEGDDPVVDEIEASIPRLQLLDDQRGGASALGFVGAQARAALLVLRNGGHTDAVTRRLLRAVADLLQLAGWMAFDAGQHGLAQRYFFSGLRAAHDAGYRSMEAHILADLSFQAASHGDNSDGVALGEAAARVADGVAGSVQASVLSRLAFAYAANGRVVECEQSWLESRDRLEQRHPGNDPAWLYYLTPNHLDCQAGYAMILAGRRQLTAGDRAGGKALLRKGEGLLRTGAYALPMSHSSQRRALYEGAWLALAYAVHGKLDEASAVTRLALPRLRQVRSPRSVELLSTLAHELRRRKRNREVADVLPELETALAGDGHRSGV